MLDTVGLTRKERKRMGNLILGTEMQDLTTEEGGKRRVESIARL